MTNEAQQEKSRRRRQRKPLAAQGEQTNPSDTATKQRNSRKGAASNEVSPDASAQNPSEPSVAKSQQNRGKKKNKKNGKKNNAPNRTTSNVSNRSNSGAVLEPYPPYLSSDECKQRYAANDPTIVRGKLRVLPGSTASAFVTCDRGWQTKDVCIPGPLERNRALDGDLVYVELIEDDERKAPPVAKDTIETGMKQLTLNETNEQEEEKDEAGDMICETWQDDAVQMSIWNPVVPMVRRPPRPTIAEDAMAQQQRKGRVVHVIPPKSVASEIGDNQQSEQQPPRRRIVGSLKVLASGTCLLTPNNKSLPQFKCPPNTAERFKKDEQGLYRAEYEYYSWKETQKWPPCVNVERMGKSCVAEDEIQALLAENDVDHGDFSAAVLKNVDDAVASRVYVSATNELGWKPTSDMYQGRRDYRNERIFTIDPTTAKDLDDALHIKELPDGRVEIGVHIADVSFFVRPGSAVDQEAQRRATTVYLVDRTVPMLPRPLCEVACSLNENVERLAFSCVWRMNLDGTLQNKKGQVSPEDVWYGRTVIKSCARLDYATAQNIIDDKVAAGESESNMDETLWPKSRRPTGGHTIDQVAADVRLMHRVAMARRKLRFDHGALALHGIKLSFQLDTDGQTPMLAAPYPIRDSNRLVEEYMLLANYLVAQRLISHANERALLRQHPEPLNDGLDKVAEVAKASINFDIDVESSQTLHASLHRLTRECHDPLVLQCVTQMLMTPMQPADYFAAGLVEAELWRHFALNIPYYTHFTSPIRRYPDVMVHRLLQATIDGKEAVSDFYLDSKDIHEICDHCNEKRMASKKAQERCDRVFLSLYVRSHPLKSQLGIVLSVGVSTFTVFIPSLGISTLLFLEEHKDVLDFDSVENEDGSRYIVLQQKETVEDDSDQWGTIKIEIFSKLSVTVYCKDRPPIDVKLRLEGPWKGIDSRIVDVEFCEE